MDKHFFEKRKWISSRHKTGYKSSLFDADQSETTNLVHVDYGMLLPGATHELHCHETKSETYLVLQGIGEWRIGETIFLLRTGDFIFVPKNTPHSINNISSETIYFIIHGINE